MFIYVHSAIKAMRPKFVGPWGKDYGNSRWHITKAQVHYLNSTLQHEHRQDSDDRVSTDAILEEWEKEGDVICYQKMEDSNGSMYNNQMIISYTRLIRVSLNRERTFDRRHSATLAVRIHARGASSQGSKGADAGTHGCDRAAEQVRLHAVHNHIQGKAKQF
jgi:hypothetical protein